MCFVLIGIDRRSDFPLVIAANRDEYYQRPTRALHAWEDNPDIIAGRDLEAGGSWLGINRNGRFAVVTNIRNPSLNNGQSRSRGELVREFLESDDSIEVFADSLRQKQALYRPFNLIFGEPGTTHYANNADAPWQQLNPGIYALSNAFLDTPWPKTRDGKTAFNQALKENAFSASRLFSILGNKRAYEPHELPDTGVSADREKMLSPIFIQSEHYGTRSSTVCLFDADGKMRIEERNHHGNLEGEAINYFSHP